jgi:hypothetical protein
METVLQLPLSLETEAGTNRALSLTIGKGRWATEEQNEWGEIAARKASVRLLALNSDDRWMLLVEMRKPAAFLPGRNSRPLFNN